MNPNPRFTLFPELLQVQSLNPLADGVSGSRAAMFASEIGQAPPLANAEIRLLQSGMEREYGKYTHSIRMPCNGVVVRVIHHFHPGGALNHSAAPISIIYQNMDYSSKIPRFGIAHIPVFSLNHHVLGFDFKHTDRVRGIRKGDRLAKGTLLAHSPSIDKLGNYRYGVNANILMASFPETRQDGVIIRKGFAEACKFKGYGEMSISFDGDEIPLNLYGDEKNYKIHPDVGELVRPDGLLFATRKLIPGMIPIQTSRKALRQPSRTDNRKITKEENARVVSVEVIHNPKVRSRTMQGMADQPIRYLEAQNRSYREMKETEDELRKVYGRRNISLSPQLHNFLVRAESRLYHYRSGRVQPIPFTDAGQPLTEYTIKIVYSYEMTPFDGHKMAESNGGKGVFVTVWDDDRMPIDGDGNVADIIMDGGSIVNRLNVSRLIEIDINASFARTRKTIIAAISLDPSPENYLRQFNWLVNAYRIISPLFAELAEKRDPVEHINAVIASDIVIWMPTYNPVKKDQAVKELLKHYPKCFGKILITQDDGTKVMSELPATIGKQYIIILEKTGEEYSAVSSPLLQSQGVPGKLTKADKQSSPGRPQATRITGETEGRIINSLVHHDGLFELLDIANSPTTHRAVCRKILTAPLPTNIDRVVDREVVPRGNNRIVGIGVDGLFAAGFGFNYRKVED